MKKKVTKKKAVVRKKTTAASIRNMKVRSKEPKDGSVILTVTKAGEGVRVRALGITPLQAMMVIQEIDEAMQAAVENFPKELGL